MTDTNRDIADVLAGRVTPTFGGEPGTPVPVVDPADIKTVYSVNREFQAQRPGEQFAVGMELFQRMCLPGANIEAVWKRATMIHLLDMISPELLSEWRNDGHLDEKVFRAAATVPLKWQEVGDGFPFDVEDFMRRVREGA
jgi:hypothetical protein